MKDKAYITHWMDELQQLAVTLLTTGNPVEQKQDGTPVTAIDRKIEEFLRHKIEETYPQDGILGEEFPDRNPQAARKWVIDPIDGTRALIAGFPTYTTLLALLEEGQPKLSTILQPVTRERWLGDGEHTLYHGAKVQCEPVDSLAQAVFSTTSPLLFRENDVFRVEQLMQTARICQFGGDAYAYGKLACGHIHLIVESGMKPYDFLPLVPIVEGAAGIITDWAGDRLTLQSNGDIIAASSESLHREALALLNAA